MNLPQGSTRVQKGTAATEFDSLASGYEELLHDPLRVSFSGGNSRFFHLRKRDLILGYFRNRGIETRLLTHLDIGCGKGELLSLLCPSFKHCVGCDPSSQMLSQLKDVESRLQEDPEKLPFGSKSFDVITAVCVYHHISPSARISLTREVQRVLKPGGVFVVVEHNPYNPITRRIVSRTVVDENAVLLSSSETKMLLQSVGLCVDASKYFLYFPESVYRHLARLEEWLGVVPLGGQYAVFGRALLDVQETRE